MAYRWNGIECDTLAELEALKDRYKPLTHSESAGEQHGGLGKSKESQGDTQRSNTSEPVGYAPNWSGCPWNPQCTKGGDCNCDRRYGR